MTRRSHGGGGLATIAALLAVLVVCGVLPSGAHAISRAAAERKALDALEVRSDTGPVVVFGALRPLRAGALITEAGARTASAGDRRGLRALRAPRVIRAGSEPAYLFHEDRGPSQAFEHPGRVALVGKRSGRVRISRTLRWIPLVDGRALPWFASAEGYASPRYRRFERGPGAQARRVAADAARSTSATGARQSVADALAEDGSCALRISDTLGDFFDYGGVDRSRAQLGVLLDQLERLNPRFASTRYTTDSGRSPAARVEQLIARRGCRDVLIYMAGGGYRGGAPAVSVGVDPDGRDALRLQDLTADSLRGVLSAHPGVRFNLVVDAPYGGRLAEGLRGAPNVGLVLTAGSAGEPSYVYLPTVPAGGGLVRNEVNPEKLLEFTNRLVRGMQRFVDAPLEVDRAMAGRRAGRAPSTMLWMLARALSLGEADAPALPIPALVTLGGGLALPGAPAIPVAEARPRRNRAPAAQDGTLAAEEDTAAELTLAATDPDGDPLTYAVSDSRHGRLTGTGAQRTYVPAPDYSGPDEISFTVSDGSERATGTVRITVAAVDDPPRLDTSAGELTYTENDPAAVIDEALELSDVDSTTLDGASVRIAGATDGDRLSFDDANGISGAYDAAARTLSLTGTATVEAYRDALRAVRYRNASDDPGAATRTVTFAAGGAEAARPVAVQPVNDAPVASGAEVSATEDVPRAIALSATDPDSDALTYEIDPAPRHGTVGGSGAQRTYTPDADYSGPDAFGFRVSDGHGGTDDGAVSLTVAAVDDPPALGASPGSLAYTENGAPSAVDPGITLRDVDTARLDTASVRISGGHREGEDVLALDPDPQNGIAASWDAAAGRLTLTGDATFAEYQAALRSVEYANLSEHPEAGTRTVSFAAAGAGATRGVAVTPVNDPPVAVDGSAATAEDTARALALRASDADGDPLTYTITTGPGHGALTGTGAARTYAPGTDYEGPDALVFEVSDASGAIDTGKIDLTVTPVNDAPRLSASAGSTQYAEDGDAKAVDAGLSLVDVDDAQISEARVAITNAQPGDELEFTDGSGVVRDGASTATSLVLTGPAAKADFQAALRSVRYRTVSDTPSTVARSVSFRADDGDGLGDAAVKSVAVAAVNDRPVAADQAVDLGENTSAPITLGATDPEGAALTYAITSVPAHGTVTGTGATRTYTPAADYHGSDAFTFTATDPGGATGTGTVSISVIKDNDVPAIGTTSGSLAYTEQAAAKLVDPDVTVADPDGTHIAGARVSIGAGATSETLSADVAGTPKISASGGSAGADLVLTGDDSAANYEAALRTVRYRSSADAPPASRTITFAATDDDGATGSATRGIAITPVNDPPVAEAGSGTVDEDTPLSFTVTGTDPDGDAITWSKTTDPANGTVSLAANGTGTYTPKADHAGPDSFTFTASDGNGASDTRTFSVTVSAVNDPAVTATSAGATAYVEDEAHQIVDGQVTAGDIDDDDLTGAMVAITNPQAGDELVFTAAPPIARHASSTATTLVLAGDASEAAYQSALRSVRYRTTSDTPAAEARVVSFRADDGDGLGAAATKLVSVTAKNDAPRLTALSGRTDEDTGFTFQLSGNDPESGSLIWAKHSDPAHGTVTVNADGSGTYTPTADYAGGDTFEFKATDADGASATAAATITVTPTPDAPTLGNGAVSGALAYTENDPATAVHDGIVVAEPDGGALARATVAIGSGYVRGQDVLELIGTSGVTGAWDDATGTMTLTSPGGAGASAFQSALRAVTYRNGSENPNPATRTVTFSITDPTDRSATLTRDIAVTPVSDPPALTTTAAKVAYTENDLPTPVDPALQVADGEGDLLSGAEIEITSGFAAGQDTLAWVDPNPLGGINRDSIASTDRKLVLTGAFSAADYVAVLRQVTYVNTSENPSATDRVVTFRATDATSLTGTASRTIGVTSVDDPPVATGDAATVLEDAAATAVDVLANDSDVDGPAVAITAATDPANGTVVPTGGSPGAHTGLTYQPDRDFCGSDSFTYTLAGTGASRTATVAMTVTCVNDAPVADDELFNGDESAHGNTSMVVNDPDDAAPAPAHPKSTVTGDILAGDTDVDGPGPLTVTPGTFETLDGGSVVIESDGDFTFHPKATRCTDTSDSFDYTVEDSDPKERTDTGRVTIAIAGCVWYVSNSADGDAGTSSAPFDTLAQAEAASQPGHTVFVHDGDNTTRGYDAGGYAMDARERLIGEHAGLVVDPDGGGSLVADTLQPPNPGAHPTLTASNADVVDLDDNTLLRGLAVDPSGAGGGVAGTAGDGDTGGGTIEDVRISDAETAGTQPGLELNGTTGTWNVTGLEIDTKATGILLTNAGTVDFGSTTITSTGAPGLVATGTNMGTSSFDRITVANSGTGGVVLSGLTGTTTLGDGLGTDLDLATTSGSTAAFSAANVTGLSVGSGGTDDVRATGGPAVDVTGAPAAALAFDDVDSWNSATDGINLAGLGTGSFGASSGDIAGWTTAGGIGFDLNGGSGDVSFPGTLGNGAGATARITGRSGGTVVLSGPINDSSDVGGGIAVTGNTGGATTFSGPSKTLNTGSGDAVVFGSSEGHELTLSGGGLDVDTTSGKGIEATGSGTLSVTADGNANTIDTTLGGKALNVTNTDVGASPLTFRRISSDGANAGIVLSGTGPNNALTVTGNGGTCDSTSQVGCTGGVIKNTTGADSQSVTPGGTGIVLNDTRGILLTRVNVRDHPNYGIRGANVVGFSLTDSVLNGTNGTTDNGAYNESSIHFDHLTGSGPALTGSASITRSFLTGGYANQLWVSNDAGSLNRLTLDAVRTGSTSNRNDSVQVEGLGSSTTNVTVRDSTFTGTAGDHFQYIANGSGGGDLDYYSNVHTNNHTAIATGGGYITLSGGAAGPVSMNVHGTNTFRDGLTNAITMSKSYGSGSLDASVTGAQIGVAGIPNSGSAEGSGISFNHNGGTTSTNATVTFANNAIHQYNNYGIYLQAGAGIASPGTLDATVTGNTIANPGTNPQVSNIFQGISLNNGVTPANVNGDTANGDSFQTCVHIAHNSLSNSGRNGGHDLRVRQRMNTTVRLPGYGGANRDTTAVANFLGGQNTLVTKSATVETSNVPSGGGFVGGAACPQ